MKISKKHENDSVFKDDFNIHDVSKQHRENIKIRQVRDQNFLHFVVRLLTRDRIFSSYEDRQKIDFQPIHKINSPIFQETKNNLLQILSQGLIRYLFIHMKGFVKLPIPVSSLSSQQDSSSIIQYIDVLDCPPLEFSDVSLDLLVCFFNDHSPFSFCIHQKKYKPSQRWSSLKNGDILLMFRIHQVLQRDPYFDQIRNNVRVLFLDPLSLYFDGQHPLYIENKLQLQRQKEREDDVHRLQKEQNLYLFTPQEKQSSQYQKSSKDKKSSFFSSLLKSAQDRIFQDDMRPFLVFFSHHYTFIPTVRDVVQHPSLGIGHPLLLRWSMTSDKFIHHLLPLLKTYHALFIDIRFTEDIVHRFSLQNDSGLRMQEIQQKRNSLSASLNIFSCLETYYTAILYKPVMHRTASEKIFLQKCEQLQFKKILLNNHRYCCELLCSVLS